MFSTSEACKSYDRKYLLDILATLWYEKKNTTTVEDKFYKIPSKFV
jgi:hypothetical protein